MTPDFREDPVPLFLKEVFQKKLSGQLSLESEGFQKQLFFSEGKLVFASSTRFVEKLLVILHLVGKISEEQYNFISGLQQFPDDQVGELLLEHRTVGKKDLYYAHLYQFRRIAISTFLMQRVKWRFLPGAEPPPHRETFIIPLETILVEGARVIERVSPYAGRWLFSLPRPLGGIPEDILIYFTDEEQAFYLKVQESPDLTCQEIISRFNLQPLDFWRKLLVFHLLGILGLERGSATAGLDKDLHDLLALHEKIQASAIDDLMMFGVSPDSSQTALEEAYANLRTRFSPERFGSAAAPETKKIAEAVSLHIDRAMQRLLPLAQAEVAAPQAAPAPPEAPLPVAPPPASPPSPPSPHPPRLGQLHHTPPQSEARNFYFKAKEYYEKNELSEAIGALKQALKLDPSQGDFYYLLGLCQSENDFMAEEAEAHLKRAIELLPWSAEPVYALGVLFRKQKKLPLAERCFQRVKEITRDHTGAGQAMIDLRRLRSQKKDKLAFLKKKIF